jgi:HSP20 family molecular chaperone IbpA
MKENDKNLNPNNSNLENKSGSYKKGLIILVSILLGVVGTIVVQDINKKRDDFFAGRRADNFHGFNDRPERAIFPFDNDIFFREMDKVEDRMNEAFNDHRKYMAKVFEDVDKNGGNVSKASVSTREDQDNYYYELNYSGFKKDEVSAEIKNDMLNFTAENKKENNDKKQRASLGSSFHYSFSLPKYNAKKAPEITKTDDKITVKLSKIASK